MIRRKNLMRDACSPPGASPIGRRDLLANLAGLAGGIVAGSLSAGHAVTAGPPEQLAAIQSGASINQEIQPRAGFFPTLWPSEHTDLWRSHTVFGAGLPADVAHRQLHVETASLNLPVWGYTRAQHEVFVIGGSPFLLDYFTKAIERGPTAAPHFDLASELQAHGRSIPYVARLDTRTMTVSRFDMQLGHTVNYTGGLLMHENGFVYAVAQSVLYKINPRTMQAVSAVHLPLVGETPAQGFWTTYNGMQVLADGQLVLKGFPNTGDIGMPGWLLLIEPNHLRIRVQQSEFVSAARLTIQQSPNGPTYLYTSSATDSVRYLISRAGFTLDQRWSRSYRLATSGSTVASSPLLYGRIGQVAFADNTAPGATTPIDLFVQPIGVNRLPAALTPVPAFSDQVPGYNFFMIAGDPFQTQTLVYYDPINRLLSAHRVRQDGTLRMLWEYNNVYAPSASPALVPDRDLLYIDNYQNGRDHFVVLRLSTGAELASVPLQAKEPTIGTIFVGSNNDVFIISCEAGTSDGLISRIQCGKRIVGRDIESVEAPKAIGTQRTRRGRPPKR